MTNREKMFEEQIRFQEEKIRALELERANHVKARADSLRFWDEFCVQMSHVSELAQASAERLADDSRDRNDRISQLVEAEIAMREQHKGNLLVAVMIEAVYGPVGCRVNAATPADSEVKGLRVSVASRTRVSVSK